MPKLIYKEQKEFYDNYKWMKVSYYNFIQRTKRKIPFEMAIKPWVLRQSLDNLKRKRKNYRERDPYYDFYHSYEGEKTTRRYFKVRLKFWYTPEEAIKKHPQYKPLKKQRQKKVQNTYKKRKKSDYLIEITYPKEVAEIFRKMYKEKIEICEEKLFQTENCRESFKIQRLKKRLEFELNIFNKRNPE